MSTNETQQRLRPLILDAMDTKGGYECARNALRYEAARKAHCDQWAMEPEEFDDRADELILTNQTT